MSGLQQLAHWLLARSRRWATRCAAGRIVGGGTIRVDRNAWGWRIVRLGRGYLHPLDRRGRRGLAGPLCAVRSLRASRTLPAIWRTLAGRAFYCAQTRYARQQVAHLD